ncbi:SEC-C metal-binding domain-containing protein [Methylococcus geothermalis]
MSDTPSSRPCGSGRNFKHCCAA